MNVVFANENADWTARDKRVNTQASLGQALALSLTDPMAFAEKFALDAPAVAVVPNIAVITEVRKTMPARIAKELRQLGAQWRVLSAAVGYQGEETLMLLYDATLYKQDLSYRPRDGAACKSLAAKLDWIGPRADDDGEQEHRKSIIAIASHMPRVPYGRLGSRSAALVSDAHRELARLVDLAREEEVDSVEGGGDYNLGKKDCHHLPRLAATLNMSTDAFAFQDNSCDNIWSTYGGVQWHEHSMGYGLFSHPPQLATCAM
jgi:hypothetical protein